MIALKSSTASPGRRRRWPGCWKCAASVSCCLPFVAETRLALIAELGALEPRLPPPARRDRLGLPCVRLDAAAASAPDRIILALDCALGRMSQVAGAFAA